MTWILETDSSTTRLAQRVVLAAVMFPHGAQKLFGWFGGHGFDGTMGFFTGQVGLPWIVAFTVILAESVGSLALAAGFLSRLAALGVAAVMIGAVLTTHLRHGFFMNWSGQQAGEGFEYHLLLLALALPIMIRGGGRYAVDRVLARASARRRGEEAPARVRAA
jgi:putative oxidoreductase